MDERTYDPMSSTEPAFPVDPDRFLAWDILFEDADGEMWDNAACPDWALVDPASRRARESVRAGRIGSRGPGITGEEWPRGSKTGLPMLHVITMWLPPAYRRRGSRYPGFALFQGEGQFAVPVERSEQPDPFVAGIDAHTPHPQQSILVDIIEGEFAMVWLTAAELQTTSAPPADNRRPGEHPFVDEGACAWESIPPHLGVRLTVRRDDPNAGFAPTEFGRSGQDTENGYRDHWDATTGELHPWAERLAKYNHLGGTLFSVQSVPEGLTPYYLDLNQFMGMNLGDGTLQLDFESGVLDWAC